MSRGSLEANTTVRDERTANRGSLLEVFLAFGRLGLTSFGGPVAHLGYFREEFVVRRRWLDEPAYADLVGLCQFLPGPASSQVGMALGTRRAGLLGGLAAWLGFTMPSALALVLFAFGLQGFGGAGGGWLHGLKIVAVAVVALALWGMARSLCPDRPRATLAAAAAVGALLWQAGIGQVGIIVAGGVLGWRLLKEPPGGSPASTSSGVSRTVGLACLLVFAVLLVGLPLARAATGWTPLAVADSFYRTGALVFGGGHVVLPLLHGEVVQPGWVTDAEFTAGYGAAQAVPGPLFTFAAYLGAVQHIQPSGVAGAALALVAVFLPAWLLVIGALPFWEGLRKNSAARRGMMGVNAAVVGLLAAALYDPIWTSAIRSPGDLALALAATAALALWRVSPWLVVVVSALAGAAFL